jgi:hypothetical protein
MVSEAGSAPRIALSIVACRSASSVSPLLQGLQSAFCAVGVVATAAPAAVSREGSLPSLVVGR